MGIQVRKANGQIFNLPDAPEFTGDGNTLPGQQLEQFYQRLFFEQASGLGDQIVVDGKVVRTNTPGNGGNFGSFVKDFVTKVVLPVTAAAGTAGFASGAIGGASIPAAVPTTVDTTGSLASQIAASSGLPTQAAIGTGAGFAGDLVGGSLASQIAASTGLANQAAIGTGAGFVGDSTLPALSGGSFLDSLGGLGGVGKSLLSSPLAAIIAQSVLQKPPRQQPQFALGQSEFGLNQDKLGLAQAILGGQASRDTLAKNRNAILQSPFSRGRGFGDVHLTATQTPDRVTSLLNTLLNATQQQTLPGNAIQQIV